MLAFPGMISEAAKRAGMVVPTNPDGEWSADDFPHFHVFCMVQLGRRMNSLSEHWGNAKIIASIPTDKIKEVTLEEVLALGISWAQ